MQNRIINFSQKDNRIKQYGFKRAVIGIAALAVSACLLITMLVVYVDPFFQYHKPLKKFPYLIDNQLSQNPGMAKHMEYDSVLLGSSMTVNFNTNWFKELMDLNTLKLSYSGAFPKDQSNIMKIIFNSDHDVKKVFLGIDVFSYTGGVEETKYPVPEYLYDNNYFNDIQYVLNKDVLLNYILRPIADPDPTDPATMYASWWTEEYYSEQWVLHNYTQAEKVEQVTEAEAYIPSVKENLDVNICPFIEKNPDTQFVIFFPPYSILYWHDVLQENHLDATIEELRYLAERLNAYENVEVYFFSDREDIILDLNHYADDVHYHPDYNYFMTRCFADGTGLVAKTEFDSETETRYEKAKTIDEYLLHLREIVETFDYEELLSRK